MGIIKGTKVTYEVTIDQIKQLIAKDLEVDANYITIDFTIGEVGDERIVFRQKDVTKILVHHSPRNAS